LRSGRSDARTRPCRGLSNPGNRPSVLISNGRGPRLRPAPRSHAA
jgi:hypothetical protein